MKSFKVMSLQKIPLVSVIVLNYNGLLFLGDGLKECIDSVLKTDYPNMEVVFVDNGSIDGSADFIRKKYGPKIEIVANDRNLGFSEGFNTGIKVTKGKYLALLSNDMTVDPKWLNPVIEMMESDQSIGLIGFKRLVPDNRNMLDGIGGDLYLCGRVKPIGTFEIDDGQWDHIVDDLDFIGGAMTLRREMLKKTGLFDPDFFIFSEDVDLCFRIRKKGYKVLYIPEAVIYHRGQMTLNGGDPRGDYLEYMSNRSRVRCAVIHFTITRLLSTLLIDGIGLILANINSKFSLMKAYFWNIKNIRVSLSRRWNYGPSPPYKPKYPVIIFRLSDVIIRLREIFSFNPGA